MPDILHISHPRRLLLLGPPKSGKLTFLRELTGATPAFQSLPPVNFESSFENENEKTPHAGLSHSYKINTSYYEAEIPIWVDEWEEQIQGCSSSGGLEAWTKQYLSPEAKEVIQALGGVIVCFREATIRHEIENVKSTLSSVQSILNKHTYGFDGVTLAISIPRDGLHSTLPSSNESHASLSADDWEALTRQYGFEFIDFSSTGRNEYGEPTGMGRVREALDSNDWNLDDDDAVSFGGLEEDMGDDEQDVEGANGFKFEVAEVEREMIGLSEELNAMTVGREGKGQDEKRKEELGEGEQVEELEGLMLRIAALKELGDDDPCRKERKRLAAQFLSSIIKEDDELISSSNGKSHSNEKKS